MLFVYGFECKEIRTRQQITECDNKTKIISLSLCILAALFGNVHFCMKNRVREVSLAQTKAEETFLVGTGVSE